MSQTKANDYSIDQQMEEIFVINLADSSDAEIALSLTKEERKNKAQRRKRNNYRNIGKTYDRNRK